jgi:hypothetical protein
VQALSLHSLENAMYQGAGKTRVAVARNDREKRNSLVSVRDRKEKRRLLGWPSVSKQLLSH